MDIIGLGQAGCSIAERFKQYPQYSIYQIDVGDKNSLDFIRYYEESGENRKAFNVMKQPSAEAYEQNCPDLGYFFKDLGEEVLFIVAGSGNISGLVLAVLEQIKDKKISVIYIRPNAKSLSGKKKLLERATFGILQEYARSGLLDNIYIISNELVAKQIGNLPVIGYFDKINDMIVSTIHFMNIFNRTPHVYGSTEEGSPVCRISTIGLLEPRTSEEKMFYNFDLVKEKSYFYAFRKAELLNESSLVSTLEEQIEGKKEKWLTCISYRLYSTEYENDYGYCTHSTSKVQEE